MSGSATVSMSPVQQPANAVSRAHTNVLETISEDDLARTVVTQEPFVRNDAGSATKDVDSLDLLLEQELADVEQLERELAEQRKADADVAAANLVVSGSNTAQPLQLSAAPPPTASMDPLAPLDSSDKGNAEVHDDIPVDYAVPNMNDGRASDRNSILYETFQRMLEHWQRPTDPGAGAGAGATSAAAENAQPVDAVAGSTVVEGQRSHIAALPHEFEPLRSGRVVFVDVETTGFGPTDCIIEMAAVEIIDCMRTGVQFHSYVNAARDSHPMAQAVHRIPKQFLLLAPPIQYVLPQFLKFVGDSPLVAHNMAFDSRMLHYEIERVGLSSIPTHRLYCTQRFFVNKFPTRAYSLQSCCDFFNIPQLQMKHSAIIDAQLGSQILYALLRGHQSMMATAMPADVTEGIEGAEDEEQRAKRKRALPFHFYEEGRKAFEYFRGPFVSDAVEFANAAARFQRSHSDGEQQQQQQQQRQQQQIQDSDALMLLQSDSEPPPSIVHDVVPDTAVVEQPPAAATATAVHQPLKQTLAQLKRARQKGRKVL